MLTDIFLIIVGFASLVGGADLLVKGSSNIAKRFHIPEIIIGLTIVALGTSMPELFITISSANKGSAELILGNAIGSNIINLMLIFALTALIRPIKVEKDVRIMHIPVALLTTLIIIIMGLGVLGSEPNVISKADGFFLIGLYLIYFLYPIIIEIKDIWKTDEEEKIKHKKSKINMLLSIIFVLIGIILLKVGGDLVVDIATKIAFYFGITERIVGLTIVALGTALPELVTSVFAAIKNEVGLATGNLVGSCIINICLILGTGAIITPLGFSNDIYISLILLSACIVFIWLACYVGEKKTITRPKALVLLATFIVYMISLFA